MKPMLVNILLFLLGTLFGHWFSLFRDKRKEFNDLTKEAFIGLNRQRLDLQRGTFGIVSFNSLLVESYIIYWRRNAFRKAVKRHEQNYTDASSYDPDYGSATFDQSKIEQLIISNQKLLKFIKPR